MTYTQPFIGVDWGTSRMRAMLIDGESIDNTKVVYGAGIGQIKRSIEEVLFEAIHPLVTQWGKVDVMMAGMVGSNIGWRTVPYLACPAQLATLGDNSDKFDAQGHQISILPGVSCMNAMGAPDVMRGEELQLYGWLKTNPQLQQSERLFCLPGTHTKWARMVDDRLESFNTALTGELFAILQQHSILIPKNRLSDKSPFDLESFNHGLQFVKRHPDSLLHTLFSTRSILLNNPQSFADPSSYLSGLLIGSDVQNALKIYQKHDAIVELIGDELLCEKYGYALAAFGIPYRISDGMNAIYSGFFALSCGVAVC